MSDDFASSSSTGSTDTALTGDAFLLVAMGFIPSATAAGVFLFVYLLLTLLFLHRWWQTRSGFAMILAVTAVIEVVGYGFRWAIISNPTVGRFIIATLTILLAPNALALVNYKVLGQIITAKQPLPQESPEQQKSVKVLSDGTRLEVSSGSAGAGGSVLLPGGGVVASRVRIPFLTDSSTGLIRGDRVARVFFASDVIAFFVQSMGGGMMASADTTALGSNIMLFGLILQIVFFALFAVLALFIQSSPLYNQPRPTEIVHVTALLFQKNKPAVYTCTMDSLLIRTFRGLFLSIVLLTIRNVYRTMEAKVDYLREHEVFILLFDSLMIAVIFLVFYATDLVNGLTAALKERDSMQPHESLPKGCEAA